MKKLLALLSIMATLVVMAVSAALPGIAVVAIHFLGLAAGPLSTRALELLAVGGGAAAYYFTEFDKMLVFLFTL
jgi:hypothetical protein